MVKALLALFFILNGSVSRAGIVNSPQSYPFSVMNQTDDFVLIGDWRLMVYWGGRFLVVPQSSPARSNQTFSGGIAERGHLHAALLCDDEKAYLFQPTRQASFPNGSLDMIYASTDPRPQIRCSMDQYGNWGILDIGQRKLVTNKWGEQPLNQNFRQAWLQYLDADLLILTDQQQMIFQESTTGNLTSQTSPFARFSAASRLTARGQTILYRNDSSLQIASFHKDPLKQNLIIENIQRIPISPCDDAQICSMSLGYDGSWIYLGYWGSYLGQGTSFERLPLLLETGRTAGTAISHHSLLGKFIFTGPYDGDWGTVKDLQTGFKIKEQQIFTSWEPVTSIATRSWSESIDWMSDLRLNEARQYLASIGLQPKTIAMGLVDSGITLQHPRIQLDLKKKNKEQTNGLDDDNNGFIDDHFGFDFVREQAEPLDLFGHGSHVAGLMASKLDGSAFSPATNGQLIVTRALDQSGKSNALDLARAIYYLVEEGAEVINLSWGGGRPSFALADAIKHAHRQGVTIFTSAGNDGLDHDKQPQVPGIYPGVISVGATNHRGQLASFSNYGSQSVSFLAPGTAVLSSLKNGQLGAMTGTSMASPLAASSYVWLLGVSKALWPSVDPVELKARTLEALCQTAIAARKSSSCGLIQLDQALRYLIARSAP